MVYDQNRPDEPQRPSGEDRPARRRIGRSWGPPAEQAPEPAEEARQGMDQAPEQYRFDPDRGRRHRYSEDPTGQVPNVPVEIAETGPMVPATRRPAPGEQFEPIPPAPQHSQAPQNFTAEQQQQQSPFAPPNQDYSAPPNQQYSAPPAMNQEYAPPQQDFGVPQQHPGYSAPPMPGDYAAAAAAEPGPAAAEPPSSGRRARTRSTAARRARTARRPSANQEYPAPAQDQSAPQQQFYSAPRQAMPSAPPANPQFAPPGVNQEFNAPPGVNQQYSAPPPARTSVRRSRTTSSPRRARTARPPA